MAGIEITGICRNKATLKVFSVLASFMFEQEFGELRGWSDADKKALERAKKVLAKHTK